MTAINAAGDIFTTVNMPAPAGSGYNYMIVTYERSAGGTLHWQWAYKAVAPTAATAMRLGSNGAPIVCGWTGSPSAALLIDYTTSGKISWVHTYNPAMTTIANDVIGDSQGNVYIVGSTTHGTSPTYGMMAKFSSAGALQWVDYDSFTTSDHLTDIALDPSGNLIFAGYGGTPGTNQGVIVGKTLPNGARAWTREVDPGTHTNDARVLLVTGGGAVEIVENNGGQTGGALLTFSDLNGASGITEDLQSVQSVADATLDANANLYVVGTNSSTGLVASKYNSTGSMLWSTTTNQKFDSANAVLAMSNGEVVAVGKYANAANATNATESVLFSSGGVIEQGWWYYLDKSEPNAAYGVVATTANDYTVCSMVYDDSTREQEPAMEQFGPTGREIWDWYWTPS
jgi:hypothetical protein